MIRIRNLTRKYGDNVAVDDVSVDISRGEIVGLLGHNGAGKTTLMKMLTGYLEPSAGTVHIDDLDVVAQRHDVQRKLGYLPENAPMYHEMLVHEYLAMMAELRGIPSDARDDAVLAAARETGLEAQLDRPIAALSKGFRQRVGIAQAIVHEPDVLILDEPTNGLDPIQIQSIRALIRRLGRKSTVLLSTHILQEVEAVCDRVLVLIDGVVAADAPLKELVSSNALRLCVNEDAKDVASRLEGIDGVEAVRRLPAVPETRAGFAWWAVDVAEGAHPAPDVVRAAHEAGWQLESIAREQQTLQTVFERLQQEHIAHRKQAAQEVA